MIDRSRIYMTPHVFHRGYWIAFNPKPVPASLGVDWDWWHDDYDGAPDSNDDRCGCAASLEDAKAAIDDQISEDTTHA